MILLRTGAVLLTLGLAVFTSAATRAFTFEPGDHFVSVGGFIPSETDYVDLSLSGSYTYVGLPGESGFSQATADIANGTLHSYATAGNGGSGYAISSLSVPVIIGGPMAGMVTIKMMVHGTWQVSPYTDPNLPGLVYDGLAQFVGYLYNFGDGLTPLKDELDFGSDDVCLDTDAGCIASLRDRTGTIEETLTLNVPYTPGPNQLIQLTGDLRAHAGGEATMDLSHTATFSISVPLGDTYSTILGSGRAPVPEPASFGMLGVGALALVAARRRKVKRGDTENM